MPPPSCCGPLHRREFLRLGTLALGGLGLSDLLAARAAGARPDPDSCVILFWMWGGPSQFETYDPKPDAPAEIRGPFRPISTAVPGIDLCELLPLQARIADRIALVRSLHHSMSAHNDGSIELLTGKTPDRLDPTSTALSEHPDFGMVASQVRGVRPDGMPRYVAIPKQPFMTRPAYLGVAHSAFATGDPSARDFRPPSLTLVGGVDGRRLEDRRGLLEQFDHLRRGLDGQGGGGGDPFREAAFQMLTSPKVASAFDLSREDPRLRTATAATSGARVACWPGGWPRRGPRSSPSTPWPRRSRSATSVGTTTSMCRPAGTSARRCGTGPRSWTRRSRR